MLITCITAFSGLSLLESCVENFLKFSDKVLICYQDVSHKGERRDVGTYVKTLASERVIITDFIPNIKGKVGNTMFKRNEREKHNQMVQFAKKLGGTHFILSAVDHFYDVEEVKRLLPEAMNYDVTFSKVHTYFKNPTWRIDPPVDYVMPFVCKLHPETRVGLVHKFPMAVDEAVKIYPFENWRFFEDFYVHNFATVDRFEKFTNHYIPLKWSTQRQKIMLAQYETYNIEQNPGLEYYGGRKIKIVPNYFNLKF